ncbi:glutamate racemase [Erythrobacter dokdonensis]|uniref:Glutamate racemase n=1 Tax=Erythrobacter dokdonensis DSW-74 TaxID=1300349 RepID=A0A1A7BKA5_9SPHN|nr:glutamate racemase [Erythrobacter dokdonensis]OBV12156.1 Glutamate racemase [Erythrobacter dokdonensis DSW-74]
MDKSSPILLFDSGVGGLTVYDALRDVLPDAPVIYASDLAGLPYGTKTEAQIAARVAGLLGRMAERYQPRLACIACNTASTIALGMVRDVLEIPVVGTVPAIKPAAALTQSGTIGLVGTEATIRQAYVDELEREFAEGKRLLRIAAPGLVEAAEAKLRGQPVDPAVIADVHDRLTAMAGDAQIDTLVLACTHFPLLAGELGEAFGPGVRQVDGAQGIARRIAHLLSGQSFAASGPNRFIVTGPMAGAAGLEAALAARGFAPPEIF